MFVQCARHVCVCVFVCLYSSARYIQRVRSASGPNGKCVFERVFPLVTLSIFFFLFLNGAQREPNAQEKKNCQSTATGCHRWLRHNHTDAGRCRNNRYLHIILCVKVIGGVERFVKK